MRLQCLDLTRYGKFTGHRIHFGPHEAGKPDLHIVYGPNEAGKSTALAAFLDLLFGIEQRSRFNFLHAYSVMRIGASLEFDGRVHHLVRIKRAQNDLLDSNDRPVSAAAIAAQLGGIDRDAYRSMFSLDDETLEAGGESILASKGDLGQLLFSASTGLADLSRALSGLQAEAAGFHRHHARVSELASLKTRLAELKQQRERIDTVASSYAQLVEARDRAQAQYDDAISARAGTQTRMDEIQRDLAALPRLARLRILRDQLAPLAELPAAPAGWRELLGQLQAEEVPLAVQSTRADAAVHQKVQELEAIAIDNVALAMGTQTDQLTDLHARYLTANNDIPDRQLEVRDCDLTIAAILLRIGRADDGNPGRLVFDARTAATFRTLIVRRSGVEAKAEAAAKELAIAKHLLQEAEANIHDGDSPIPDKAALAAIAAVLAALNSDNHAARLRLAERARLECLAELRERLAELHPWSGDADQLALLVVPEPGEVQQWKTDLAAAQSRADQLETDVGRSTEERQRLEAERAAITRILGVVGNDNAAAVRAEREAAWLAHRGSLDRGSADVFEAALRRDDAIVDARMRHETELARLHQTDQALAVKTVGFDQTKQRLDAALAQLQAVRDRIASAVAPLLPGETSLPRLEAWLVRRDKALETRGNLKQAERDARDAEADAEILRTRLIGALRAASVRHDADAPLDVLRGAAEAAVARDNEISNLRTAVAQRRREVSARDVDMI